MQNAFNKKRLLNKTLLYFNVITFQMNK